MGEEDWKAKAKTFLMLTSVLVVVRDKPSPAGFVEAASGRVRV